MNAERWERIAELFDSAAELPPSDRARFLDSACAGDAELRAEVEAMLAHDSGDSKIAEAVSGAVAEFDPETHAASQTKFGTWRVTGRLGAGGMGTVYKAVRGDGTFEKEAALKVLHTDSPETLERFRRERQILARLEHPNIARLIDGGETRTGAPFLVMEFVRGETLLAYAERARLNRDQRLRLFLGICAAVQYLHQNLVVHRDLKPSNILVTGEGVPKLLDFGIAKVLHDDAKRTATGLFALTPQYASPEQVRGLPVTVSTDIYSLGVVLYELLKGKPPYEFATLAPLEVDRVICEAPVERPGLGADLDNILLMALRKEPERRYPTVDQFARDIERSMSNLPVAARPDTLAYRAGKFARRNWIAVAGLTIVLGSLATGVVVTQREATRAKKRFLQARLFANGLLNDFYPRIQNLTGATEARGALMKSTLEYLNQLAAEAADDPELQLDLAVSFEKIGDLQGSGDVGNTGEYDAAMKTFAESKRLAAAAMAGGADRKRSLETLALAEIGIGEASMNLGQWDLALQALRRGKAVADQIPDFRHSSSAYNREGDIYSARGELERALHVFVETDGMLDMARAAPITRASTWQRIAQVNWDLGRMPEARDIMLRTSGLVEEARKARPESLFRILTLINSHGQTAALLGGRAPSLGKPGEALPFARSAYSLTKEAMVKDTADAGASRGRLIELAQWIGPVFRASDRELLARLEADLASAGEPGPRMARAIRESSLGYCRAGLGGHREALANFQRAAEISRELMHESPDQIPQVLLLGWTLIDWSESLRGTGADGRSKIEEAAKLASDWSARVPKHAALRALRDAAVKGAGGANR